VLVTAGRSLAKWLRPVDGRPGVFRTDGVGRDRDVELVPFYKLHRRVHAAYWDVLSPERWAQRSAAMMAAQEAQRKLEAATVAFAQPGQMQTERDFNQLGGNSSPVQFQGRYGRRAVDWFSFDVPVDPASPLVLIVTCNTDERFNRLFDGSSMGRSSASNESPDEVRRNGKSTSTSSTGSRLNSSSASRR
jgi:hypothetical protein